MTRARKIKRTWLRLYVKGRRTGMRLRRSRRTRVAAAGAAIVAAAFAVGTWVAVPLWVAEKLSAWASAEPGRSAEVGRVRVNPFTLTVALDDLQLAAPNAQLDASTVVLNFDAGALLGRTFALDALELDQPTLRLHLASPTAAEPRAAQLAGAIPTMPFRIDAAGIDRGRIEWLDRASPSEPLVLGDITLRAFGLDDTAEEAGRFALDVRDAARGVLAAEGEIAVGTRRIDAHAEFENIDVAPIAALWFASPVISGAASGSAALEWSGDSRTLHLRDASLRTIRLGAVHPDGTRLTAASAEAAGDARWLEGQLHFSGRIDLDRATVEPSGSMRSRAEAGPPLDAERIEADGVSASWTRRGFGGAAQLGLAGSAWADALVLTAPRARVVLGAGEASGWLDTALSALSAPRRTAPTWTTDRIEILRGELDVTDAALGADSPVLRLSQADGMLVRGDGEHSVAVELDTTFADGGTGALEWRGSLSAERAHELRLELHGVPSAAFGRYAERYAGFAVEGGLMDADVDYRRFAEGIDGTVRLRAQGVELADAADPMLRLAFALLDAPDDAAAGVEAGFSGRAADETRELIAAALLTRLHTLAAVPFVALGNAVGVDGSRLESVPFVPGEAAPTSLALDALDTLAESLRARPRVGLRVSGAAHRVTDRDALAAQQIELHVTLATAGPRLVARPLPVDFESPRHRDVLDEFAGERLSDERRETIASYFRRTVDGRVVEEDRSAYYRALFDALVESERIDESGIERLGRYRARAIADALTARGIAEERVEVAPVVMLEAAEGEGVLAEAEVVDVPLDVFSLE